MNTLTSSLEDYNNVGPKGIGGVLKPHTAAPPPTGSTDRTWDTRSTIAIVIVMVPEPTNDHERAIAKIIEARCMRRECSYEGGLLEVSSTVDFLMSESDIKYLVALMKKNCVGSTLSRDAS